MDDLTNQDDAPQTEDEEQVDDEEPNGDDESEGEDANNNFNQHRQSYTDSPAPSATTPGAGSTPGPGSCASTPGLSSLMESVSLPSAPPISNQHREDFRKVREAFQAAGGSSYKTPPDFEKLKPRPGQSLEVVNEDLDIGLLAETPDRPDEQSLERVPDHVLLLPESTSMVPLDFQMDYTLPEFVKEQRIELAVVCKPLDNSTDKWGFPPAKILQEVFDHIRDRDEVEIVDVCLWSRVEKSTGIASIMLSTINLALFIETRHKSEPTRPTQVSSWRPTRSPSSWTGMACPCTCPGTMQTSPPRGFSELYSIKISNYTPRRSNY